MNDNDVIKALEELANKVGNVDDIYFDGHKSTELYMLLRNTLLLINRLQAKNEELSKENDDLKNGYFQKRYEAVEHLELMGLRKAWENARKECDYFQFKAMNLEEDIKTAKSEARKEFAERLKIKGFSDDIYGEAIVYVTDIDNLLAEMEGKDGAK